MKRTELKRKSGLRRSAKPMTRTRVKPVNRERRAKSNARNFSDEAEAVRAMPCLCMDQDAGSFFLELELAHAHGAPEAIVICKGAVEPAHNPSRGAGGGRFDITPLCKAHHDEQHETGVGTFAARYGLDLRAEADRIAVSHAPPLGIRGLAQRWAEWLAEADSCSMCGTDGVTVTYVESGADVCGTCGAENCCTQTVPCPLTDYETDALLGWVRRECEREAERRRVVMLDANSKARLLGLDTYWWADHERLALVQREQRSRGGAVWDGIEPECAGALAAHVATALGLDDGLAEQLLDAAEVGHE